MNCKHDEYFMRLAEQVATRSKDPSTKTGAIIVDADGRVVSTGFNGFPRLMEDLSTLYADRDEKLSRIVHCEMNALIFARQNLQGCTLYTWPFMSCDRCAVHMLQAGIKRFVTYANDAPRWQEAFERTRRYIKECGATLVEMEPRRSNMHCGYSSRLLVRCGSCHSYSE